MYAWTQGTFSLRRRLLAAAVLTGALNVAIVWRTIGYEQLPAWTAGFPAAVAALVSLALFMLMRLIRATRHPKLCSIDLAVIAAVGGLLGTIPLPLSWDDGCNRHSAYVAALAAPVVLLAKPRETRISYLDYSTLMDCANDGRWTPASPDRS